MGDVGARYRYVQEVHDEEGYWPIWAPDVHLDLGDVGFFKGLQFERQTSLTNLGIDFSVDEDPTLGDRKYATKGSVEFHFKAMGSSDARLFPNVPTAEAGIRVDFNREKSSVYAFLGCQQDSIDDIPSVARQLAQVQDRWDDRFVIITQVVRARSGTVLVSEQEGSALEFGAKADLGADFITLAKLDVGVSRRAGSMMAHETIAQEGLTPLYRAARISKGGVLEPLGVDVLADGESVTLVDAGPDLSDPSA